MAQVGARRDGSAAAGGRRLSRGAFALAAWLAAALLGPPAGAEDFYRGKTITLTIAFGVGGTYDLYGRVVATYLGRHIPGEPTVIVRNMPGAGGIVAANYMGEVAPHDGTALCVPSEQVALDQLFGTTGVAYDPAKFLWVGRMTPSETAYFTWFTSPTKSFADLKRRETTFGSSGSGATTDTPRALTALAGAKFKLVTGYRGSADVLLALERGEIEGAYALWPDLKKRKAEWLADKKVNLIFTIAEHRLKDTPDVPNVAELAPTEEGRAILRFFASTGYIGRAILTTSDVPADRLAILRKAFLDAMADRDLLADATKLGMPVDPADGAALQEYVGASLRTPKDLVAKAKIFRQP